MTRQRRGKDHGAATERDADDDQSTAADDDPPARRRRCREPGRQQMGRDARGTEQGGRCGNRADADRLILRVARTATEGVVMPRIVSE